MKKFVTSLLAMVMLLSLCTGCGGQKDSSSTGDTASAGTPSAETVVLRLANSHNAEHITSQACQMFADLVNEKTDGRITIECHFAGELGDERSTIEQCQFGGLDFTRVSSGASAGAALALLTPISFLAGQRQTTAYAFLGALFSAFIVYYLAKKAGGGKLQPVTLLLSGTAVNAVMSAITSFLIFRAKSPESIAAVYSWQMGSISAAQWKSLAMPAAFVAAGIVIFTVMGSRFNMMMMGDEDAAAMGLRVKLFRSAMFLVCSLVVASLVSITGIIGFVGLVVPHVTRLVSRTSDNRIVMPMSALVGSVFILWADAFARCAFGAVELPIGIVTAFIGAPFFMFLMIRNGYGGGKQ